MRASGYHQVGVSFDFEVQASRECVVRAAGACFGQLGVAYCDGRVLARTLEIMAFLASEWAVNFTFHASKRGELPGIFRADMETLVTLVDAVAEGRLNEVDAATKVMIAEGIPEEDMWRTGAALASVRSKESAIGLFLSAQDQANYLAYVMYEAASNYVFAYLLGHELGHSFRRCVFPTLAHVEATGLAQKLADAQREDSMLCRNPMFIDETAADECGLRAVDFVDREMIEWKKAAYRQRGASMTVGFSLDLLSISRKLAVDTMAWFLTVGFNANATQAIQPVHANADGTQIVDLVMPVRRGYYYGPLRAILFAAELTALEKSYPQMVRLCGRAAEHVAIGLRYSLESCGRRDNMDLLDASEKEFAVLLGEYVPSGLKQAWQTNGLDDTPDPNTFACKGPAKRPGRLH